MTAKTTHDAPLTIDVVSSQTVEDVLTKTRGLLELIEAVCNTATGEDDEEVFSPDLLKTLPLLCMFAARDLAFLEIYLSKDAADFHKNQIKELALQAPGGGK